MCEWMSIFIDSALTDERRELPLVLRAVVPQDEGAPVVRLHLEVAMLRIDPAIGDLEHFEAPLAEDEAARLFLAAVAGVAVDADLESQATTKSKVPCPRSGMRITSSRRKSPSRSFSGSPGK